ncbi:glyoxalase [uncultured Croceitalea sp.]|uniref:glyoxalase n=1 Tax=uncultured Croceitalea sp. TaxID=1798908 RepID=UPI00330650AD
MEERSINLLKIRPDIKTTQLNDMMGNEERFQNETLRPVLKMQNDLFIAVFKNYIRKHKNAFYELSAEKRLEYIEKSIQKDIKFRNSLKGMVIGQFTVEEYEVYIQNSSALNKRMMNMVIKRLKDQLQLLENKQLAY